MTSRTSFISLILLLAGFLPAHALKERSVQELIDRASIAKVDDRPGIYVDIVEKQLKNADDLYSEGKVIAAADAIKDVVTYSDKAHDAAIASPKKLKSTEIALRKSAAKLRDIKRTLNFDDQAPVQAAADRLEQLRTDILNHMFAKN